MKYFLGVLVLWILCQNTLAEKEDNPVFKNFERRLERLEDRVYENLVIKMLQQDAPPEREEKTFKIIGSKSYYIETDEEKKKTWPEAVNYCKQLDAHLASPQNETEFLFLQYNDDIYKEHSRSYWIDITDHVSEGTYLSQTSGLPAPYLQWKFGGANSLAREEDCVEMLAGYAHDMNNANCMDKNFYICEKNPEEPFITRLWKWITE